MIRRIRLYPDPVLRQQCEGVKHFDKALKRLVDDLFETMYARDGIGLAAPQIGVLQDVFVIDVRQGKTPIKPLVFVNPCIAYRFGEDEDEEQCLSLPGRSILVCRSAEITVVAQTELGNVFSYEAKGLESRCIQHEADHLKGKLLLDYITSNALAAK